MTTPTRELVERLRDFEWDACKEAASRLEHLDAENQRLRDVAEELILATNEVIGWHRTDKIVPRGDELEQWQQAKDAARNALSHKTEG